MLFEVLAGPRRLAGVDEVGRGALVGPLVVAAVICDAGPPADPRKLMPRAEPLPW